MRFIILLIAFLFVSPAFAGVIGDTLFIGQVVTPDSNTPCFDCSSSGQYVVRSVLSQTTTTINLTSFANFNYSSTLKKKDVSGTVDYIDVYRYEGPELTRNFTAGTYSFSVTRYAVNSLDSVLLTPSKDVSGVGNASRLSALQGQMSSSNQHLSMVYKNISSVRSNTSDSGSLSKIVSFFVGALSSTAFVMAVRKRL